MKKKAMLKIKILNDNECKIETECIDSCKMGESNDNRVSSSRNSNTIQDIKRDGYDSHYSGSLNISQSASVHTLRISKNFSNPNLTSATFISNLNFKLSISHDSNDNKSEYNSNNKISLKVSSNSIIFNKDKKNEISNRSLFYTPSSTICNYYLHSNEVTPTRTESIQQNALKVNLKQINLMKVYNTTNNPGSKSNTSNNSSKSEEHCASDINDNVNIASTSRTNLLMLDKKTPIKYTKSQFRSGEKDESSLKDGKEIDLSFKSGVQRGASNSPDISPFVNIFKINSKAIEETFNGTGKENENEKLLKISELEIDVNQKENEKEKEKEMEKSDTGIKNLINTFNQMKISHEENNTNTIPENKVNDVLTKQNQDTCSCTKFQIKNESFSFDITRNSKPKENEPLNLNSQNVITQQQILIQATKPSKFVTHSDYNHSKSFNKPLYQKSEGNEALVNEQQEKNCSNKGSFMLYPSEKSQKAHEKILQLTNITLKTQTTQQSSTKKSNYYKEHDTTLISAFKSAADKRKLSVDKNEKKNDNHTVKINIKKKKANSITPGTKRNDIVNFKMNNKKCMELFRLYSNPGKRRGDSNNSHSSKKKSESTSKVKLNGFDSYLQKMFAQRANKNTVGVGVMTNEISNMKKPEYPSSSIKNYPHLTGSNSRSNSKSKDRVNNITYNNIYSVRPSILTVKANLSGNNSMRTNNFCEQHKPSINVNTSPQGKKNALPSNKVISAMLTNITGKNIKIPDRTLITKTKIKETDDKDFELNENNKTEKSDITDKDKVSDSKLKKSHMIINNFANYVKKPSNCNKNNQYKASTKLKKHQKVSPNLVSTGNNMPNLQKQIISTKIHNHYGDEDLNLSDE